MHKGCRHALILTKSFLENLVVVLARLIGLIQLNAHVIHARPTYSHSRRADRTVTEVASLRGFIAGFARLIISPIHISPLLDPLSSFAIPKAAECGRRERFSAYTSCLAGRGVAFSPVIDRLSRFLMISAPRLFSPAPDLRFDRRDIDYGRARRCRAIFAGSCRSSMCTPWCAHKSSSTGC